MHSKAITADNPILLFLCLHVCKKIRSVSDVSKKMDFFVLV